MQNDISIQRGKTQPEGTKGNEAWKHVTWCGTWKCLRSCLRSELVSSEHQRKGSISGHRNWPVTSSPSHRWSPKWKQRDIAISKRQMLYPLRVAKVVVAKIAILEEPPHFWMFKEGCLVWQLQGHDSNSGQRQTPSQIVSSTNSVTGQKEELICIWNIGWFKWFFYPGSPAG